MIINGEKVPAFSATTLSIPNSPVDNLEAIINSSREKYSRPRAEVEEEIKETIEASEKYKKELSDSGRAAGEQGTINASDRPAFMFKAADITKSKSYNPTARTRDFSNRTRTERKPRPETPTEAFKKLKLSPNAAEEKTDRPGLKDLGKLFATKTEEIKVEAKPEKREEIIVSEPPKSKRRRERRKKKNPLEKPNPMPVKPPVSAPSNTTPSNQPKGIVKDISGDGFYFLDKNNPSEEPETFLSFH